MIKGDRVHLVEPDQNAIRGLSASQLARRASEIIDSMVARAPEELRAEFRKQLEDPSLSASFAGSLDPEIARLGAVLAGIRAEQTPMSAPGRSTSTAKERTRVLVALVPSLSTDASVRAAVVRSQDDRGVPVLLVRQQDVTARDIAAGLRAASMSVARHGVSVKRPIRFEVRSTTKPSRKSLVNENYVKLLRSAQPYEVPGIGSVPATLMLAPPR